MWIARKWWKCNANIYTNLLGILGNTRIKGSGVSAQPPTGSSISSNSMHQLIVFLRCVFLCLKIHIFVSYNIRWSKHYKWVTYFEIIVSLTYRFYQIRLYHCACYDKIWMYRIRVNRLQKDLYWVVLPFSPLPYLVRHCGWARPVSRA